jgi:uncharacterized protein YbjT (DUF2867 family)
VRVLVTGGSGDLGRRVVRELTARGHSAVAESRRTGVDLATGEGLDQAVEGIDAVVHCASNPLQANAVDVRGTRRLAAALARHDQPAHLVYISIVGCDLNPYPYYRAKFDAEKVVEDTGIPATVVRATQFHSLAAFVGRLLTLGPIAFTLGDMAVQPVDTDFVAAQLVEVAAGPAPTAFCRAADVAGPEMLTMGQIARALRAHAGKGPPRVVRLPPVGRTLRAFSARTNVPSGDMIIGGRSFSSWLAEQPPRLRGR